MANYYWNGHKVEHALIADVTDQAEQVSAVADKQILVLGYTLSLDAVGEVLWESASDNLTGLIEVAADTPLVVGYGGVPVLECATAEALNLTGTTAANGHLSYVVVDP